MDPDRIYINNPGDLDSLFDSNDVLIQNVPSLLNIKVSQTILPLSNPQEIFFAYPEKFKSKFAIELSNFKSDQLEQINRYYLNGTSYMLSKFLKERDNDKLNGEISNFRNQIHGILVYGSGEPTGTFRYRINEKFRTSLTNHGRQHLTFAFEFNTPKSNFRLQLSTNENISIGYIRGIQKNTSFGINVSSTRRGNTTTIFAKYKNFKSYDQNQSSKNKLSAVLLYLSSCNLAFDLTFKRIFSNLSVCISTNAIWNLKKRTIEFTSGIINTFKLPFLSYPLLVSMVVSSKGYIFSMIGIRVENSLGLGIGFHAKNHLFKYGLFIDI